MWIAAAQLIADQHEGFEERNCDVGRAVDGRDPFVERDFFEGRHGGREPGVELERAEPVDGFFGFGGDAG